MSRPFDLVLKINGFEKHKNVKITKNTPNAVKNH